MNHPRPPAAPDPFDPAFQPTQTLMPSQDALPPGTRLAEYEVVRVLGEGGFGIVYLAADHGLQRHVAIKEYLPAALAARGARAAVTLRATSHAETFKLGLRSFVNEARLLARFDHPSLVRVYRFWEANGTAYMVMPYYEGTTVAAARLAMTRPPDEAWLRQLLLSLMGALEVLHASSCYHRDIAPDNVLVLPDGRPVLLDFGAARRVIGDRTQTLTAILKPAYAPIEQYAEAGHLQQGPWTDLYALGAVMYYLISGRSPLPSTVRAVDDQLRPLAEVAASLQQTFTDLRYSPSFLAAIEWALAVRPQDRPQTVTQLRDALDAPGWVPPRRPRVAAPPAAPPEATAIRPPVAPEPAPAAEPAWFASIPPATVAPATPQPPAGTPPPAAAPARPPAATSPAAAPGAVPPTLSEEVPSDAAVMAALDAALGSLPDDRPDAAWGTMRPDEDDLQRRAAARRGPATTRWMAALAILLVLGAAAWQWQERWTTQQLLERLANTPLAPDAGPAPEAATATAPSAAVPSPAPVTAQATPAPSPPVPAPAPAAPPDTPVAAGPTPHADPVSTRAESTAPQIVEVQPSAPAAPPQAATPAAPAAPAAPPRAEASRDPPEEDAEPDITRTSVVARPSSPRAACGTRTNFALYYCMQTQCRQAQFVNHPHCVYLRQHDEVMQ
ncbi:serine/threonine protein kinase [Caldimonas thermodepolymerans]|uniref:Serine/threonine protein kinase n=1 Tax=Caldimonas thermodepolymerans TaxID=215580 RepID=A0A2S5T719_9BURK|nr:serine/threonine-protein kinase [Caldimonas thermodepolymerans]PPE70688.1 serine/threonine protein kinase [Caldimonas thermodepolymerans]QPC33223.1 serine/threonine protein kinase [Caldimonas thermodepolymerans]RDH97545.1 serine/threonine protein kinase [Caldimonas thermodepolymerans]TCP09957.1 serine/threonine protein kinase [Caldimonas thermodepolymerans]UZG46341.1 serine/threonine protein kinase [Caldimonas thermodepolymerans]